MDRDFLNEAARGIKAKLPDQWCFILLAAEQGEPREGSRVVYVSDMTRETAINVLKEWLIKASGEEGWMKHIK